MNYAGNELELFARAQHWKKYWSARVRPYLRGDVLEVGSGLGSNIPFLFDHSLTSWTALEPDAVLLQSSRSLASRFPVHFLHGDLSVLERRPAFDTILYIDVLEHIQRDEEELVAALARLRPGGHIVILVPAFMTLYSAYDAAIGHCRRYTRRSLRRVMPARLSEVRLDYLDAAGLLLSLANRLLLRQELPTPAQVGFWDRCVIPVSRFADPVLGYSCGRSLLGVWALQ